MDIAAILLLILAVCGAIVVWALITEEWDQSTSGGPVTWVEVDASEE